MLVPGLRNNKGLTGDSVGVNANSASVTTSSAIMLANEANNFVINWYASDFVSASYLYWFLTVSMDGVNYAPLQIPHSPVLVVGPGAKSYNAYSVKTDCYSVNANDDLSGVVILPFLFHSAKVNAFTDIGTASFLIGRYAPAVA